MNPTLEDLKEERNNSEDDLLSNSPRRNTTEERAKLVSQINDKLSEIDIQQSRQGNNPMGKCFIINQRCNHHTVGSGALSIRPTDHS